jgi:nickel/cobalt transporter (NicO) family protein
MPKSAVIARLNLLSNSCDLFLHGEIQAQACGVFPVIDQRDPGDFSPMRQIKRRLYLILAGCFSMLMLHLVSAPSSLAHWADLAVADVTLDRASAQVVLTIPTGLVAAADDDRNGQLSPTEIRQHQTELQTYLGQKIELKNNDNQPGSLVVSSVDFATNSLPASSTSHSNLQLVYSWPRPIAGVKMRYSLFEPGVPTARCLATIKSQLLNTPTITNSASTNSASKPSAVKNVIFSPENQEVVLLNNAAIDWSKGLWVTMLGAFIWGAAHATSPGHGKTLVGTYLIGERATAQHAIFLGLTTTVTHTLGVFTLGAFMLLAAQTVLPELVLPWLSLVSGLLVVLIGGTLLRDRLTQILSKSETSYHHHAMLAHAHSHDHDHHHSHDHHHGHDYHHHHDGHTHSHLPPENMPVSWRSLFALGVSGGLIPCPSALVLLLGAIAIGQVAYGLLLVFSFSLGLAVVLTGLGLMLIYAKKLFVKLPTGKLQRLQWIAKLLPAGTAFIITLIGIGISIQALWQIKGLPL